MTIPLRGSAICAVADVPAPNYFELPLFTPVERQRNDHVVHERLADASVRPPVAGNVLNRFAPVHRGLFGGGGGALVDGGYSCSRGGRQRGRAEDYKRGEVWWVGWGSNPRLTP